ncbi:virulence factor MVIN domain protein [Peptoniphilus sp. oral taxon 375 str. F0436]|nr:virulence factor MVIN domain protein [Peptoniphilus sp. oral taxon 375 str. F0436]
MKQTSMILMVVTVLAKVFGLAREKALAQFFGVSPMADIFIVALSIPMLFTNLLTGALGTGFIPVYNEIEEEKGHVRAELFTSNVTNTLALFFFYCP